MTSLSLSLSLDKWSEAIKLTTSSISGSLTQVARNNKLFESIPVTISTFSKLPDVLMNGHLNKNGPMTATAMDNTTTTLLYWSPNSSSHLWSFGLFNWASSVNCTILFSVDSFHVFVVCSKIKRKQNFGFDITIYSFKTWGKKSEPYKKKSHEKHQEWGVKRKIKFNFPTFIYFGWQIKISYHLCNKGHKKQSFAKDKIYW